MAVKQELLNVRVPLVGHSVRRSFDSSDRLPGISTFGQRFVNVIFRKYTDLFGKEHIFVCKRPGTDGGTDLSGSTSETPWTVLRSDYDGGTGQYMAISKSTNADEIIKTFSNSSGAISVTGPVDSSRITRHTDSQDGAFWIVTANGTNRKAITFSGASNTEITDADFPDSTAVGVIIGNFVFMDGYLFIMTSDDGRIYNSDINDTTSWSAISFLTVQAGTRGAGLARYKDKIVAFGSDYIEFYENVGNVIGSPLGRVNHLRQENYGISITNLPANALGENTSHRYFEAMGTVFWINNPDTEAGPGVFMLDNHQPKKISTPDVDFDLIELPMESIRFAGVINLFGYNYLLLSTGDQSTDYAWAYCFELGIWVTWESALLGPRFFVLNNSPATDTTLDEILLFNGTEYFKFSVESLQGTSQLFTDDGVAFTMTIQTENIDLGTLRRKRLRRLAVVGDDSLETSTTGISWSDDDQQTYTTARNVDMNSNYPVLTNLGLFRKRSFRLTNSDNAPFAAEALELDYEVSAT